MSTLKVDTLLNRAGTDFPENLRPVVSTAWVTFNGTDATPSPASGAYNISSITDNGTGNFTVNFVTAMDNTDYAVSCESGFTNNSAMNTSVRSDLKTVSNFNLLTFNGVTAVNASQVSAVVFGGKN